MNPLKIINYIVIHFIKHKILKIKNKLYKLQTHTFLIKYK